ncbi:MAG: HAD family hydrolase [Chloroflexota bacterium]|jgi:putative hydrolase of the HAD superfamily
MIPFLPSHILFDWGDTVMCDDDPISPIPMVAWPSVRAVPGVEAALAHLQAAGCACILATSAAISDEAQIRGALERVGLAPFFARIYCFKNTGLPKGEAFYRHILADLGLPAASAWMVGDSFEKDVLAANRAGLFAIWFNPYTDETRSGEGHVTVHSMQALLALFQAQGAG